MAIREVRIVHPAKTCANIAACASQLADNVVMCLLQYLARFQPRQAFSSFRKSRICETWQKYALESLQVY